MNSKGLPGRKTLMIMGVMLALIGILNAFVALYYYLNIIKHMYLYRSDDEEIAIPVCQRLWRRTPRHMWLPCLCVE